MEKLFFSFLRDFFQRDCKNNTCVFFLWMDGLNF